MDTATMRADLRRRPLGVAMLCVLLYMTGTVSVHAGCTLTSGGGKHEVRLRKQQIMVPSDTKVGDEILIVHSDLSAIPKYTCRNLTSPLPTPSLRKYFFLDTPLVANMPKTYETGVKGIGVQVFGSSDSVSDKYHFPRDETSNEPIGLLQHRDYTLSHHGATYRFVRTSMDSGHGVINGHALPTAIAHAYMPKEPEAVAQFLYIIATGTLEIVAPTCQLTAASRSQTLTLPPAVPQTIVDSKAPSTAFNIEVNNCSHTSSVRFSFQGQPAGATGTPAGAWLKNTGTAQGLGIGIQSVIGTDAKFIRFDKQGGAHVRSLTPGADRGVKLALRASYQALAPGASSSVTPGSVDATATVQVDYL